MTCTNLRFLFASALALSLTTVACGDDRGDSASATEATTAPTTTDATMGDSTTTNTPTTSTTAEPTAGTGTASETGTTAPDEPTTTTATTATTAPACQDMEDQPINSPCTDSSGCGCDTEKCFVVPALGGFCGECLTDADCSPGGCSVPNPIAGVGATCNMGGPGEGCMSDAVCVDADNGICGTLLEVPGIITVATCGQCKVNADCTDPAAANCTPTYDVPNFKGKLDCVADGSVPNNLGCSLEDDGGVPAGNKACMSGFCGEASVMGLLKLGVCGECNSDADCQPGEQCTDPAVDLDMGALVGSVCM
ncbi:hypothetical protein SAMN02745121_01987 [Nannocystis exedens]|uniref:Tryptophan synthase alpha chain n=1 Tax=Nannocystis exedens TaxID=54 RepID=A0A1I1VV49_9BACT|nr:hypothetical protein [Nannocystis exedens]PCC72869.1 hypothetical protein NAEX_05955 [Nannocystis exedens]SFD86781.1 hypothetical protein SAMN02745121_01987 [Nannocystis exedens]